ncbi:MAG: TauD/TfdA family dioxygenase [Bacteroidales bacterium]|nr:TauD/TfdA family dioxygenase [Bacteroidales bacterium]
MNLSVKNIEPRIGAEVEADIDILLSGKAKDQLRDLLEERGVILFRDMEITDEQHLAFSKTLGTIEGDKSGEVYKVSVSKKVNPEFAEYNLGNFSWHMDRTDLDMPNFCTILRPQKLSPAGGETQFANTYAAYEDLPAEEKAFLDDLKVVHRVESSFREKVPHPTEEQLARWRTYPPKVHPLVWHHKSGRNSLALSTSATEVVGMDPAEGTALLKRLMEWATQPQYVYTHEWRMGDLLMWDNTGTMHRVLPYDPDSGRCLHRTTLAGEEALV